MYVCTMLYTVVEWEAIQETRFLPAYADIIYFRSFILFSLVSLNVLKSAENSLEFGQYRLVSLGLGFCEFDFLVFECKRLRLR